MKRERKESRGAVPPGGAGREVGPTPRLSIKVIERLSGEGEEHELTGEMWGFGELGGQKKVLNLYLYYHLLQ